MTQQIYDMELVTDEFEIPKGMYTHLLLAPNVEKRSREAFLRLKNKDAFQRAVIMDYENFHKELDAEQEETFYDDFDMDSSIIVKGQSDTEIVRQLCRLGIREEDYIAIDITGFSIPNIYCIMNVLKNVIKIKHLDVFYTEPKFYIYGEGYYDAYHKDIKERSCEPVPGYCNFGEDEKEILVIFLGFDGGLADQVYFQLGEDVKEILQTFVVNGFPSYTAKLKDVSLFNNEDLINKIERENVLSAEANNPFDVYNLLCKVLERDKGTLLNLCSIGSKPMALGVCLFALDYHEKVKVTYPFYEKTKFDVDEEPGKIWKYGLDFC